ncbi:MAG: hypothetical protein GY794_10120 [bacterium]|nr:hypothetical protein [bacterium]
MIETDGSMDILPATFQRAGSNKLFGLLVYILWIPTIVVVLGWILLMIVVRLLTALDMGANFSMAVIIILLLMLLVGVIIFGVRHYRRRAFIKIVIDRDRIVINRGRKPLEILLTEIQGICLGRFGSDAACILDRLNGKPVCLPPNIAPFSAVEPALNETVIPHLLMELNERLENGQPVVVCESHLKAFLRMVGGLCTILVSTLTLSQRGSFGSGFMRVRCGWIGMRGGFILYRGGLSPRSGDERSLVPWEDLKCIRCDMRGLVYRSVKGETFAASPVARNYVVVSAWLLDFERNRNY